jgi:hypothetical protein
VPSPSRPTSSIPQAGDFDDDEELTQKMAAPGVDSAKSGPGLLLSRLREAGLLDAGLRAAAHPGAGEAQISPGAEPDRAPQPAAADPAPKPAPPAAPATPSPRPRPGPTPRQAAAMDSAAALHRHRRSSSPASGGGGKLGQADASVPSSWWAQAVQEEAEQAADAKRAPAPRTDGNDGKDGK